MSIKAHFDMMAKYNEWANRRLYIMASALSAELYRRDVGAYFKSIHGTLNHLLTADRIWMSRLTNAGDHPDRLDAVVFEELASLTSARQREDERIIRYVAGLTDSSLVESWDYKTLNGTPQQNTRAAILGHLFNHQTHHRGQAHAILTVLGVAEPQPLDLMAMLREGK
jgi:uncharacterized damage-inducible protein DinB